MRMAVIDDCGSSSSEGKNHAVHGFGTLCRMYTKSVPGGCGKKQTKFLFYSEQRNKSGLFYPETLNGIVKKLVIPKNPLW